LLVWASGLWLPVLPRGGLELPAIASAEPSTIASAEPSTIAQGFDKTSASLIRTS